MTLQQYQALSAPFRSPGRTKALNVMNRLLTGLCYGAYPLYLLLLAFQRDGRIVRAVLVPAVTFAILSVFRSRYNAPRPYEVLEGMQPLIHKDTHGRSFPSRHVFSMFIIAMTFLWLEPWLGWVFLAFGAALALCRVIGGVHWPRDVLAGAAFGILSGVVGFWLI